jgi:putative peptide zinc metalloprotease protein
LLAGLFRPAVAWLLVLTLLSTIGVALIALPTPTWSSVDVFAGYALLLGSLAIHELGHAAACARYGVPPGEIGLTVYLIYPAFYSDVTSAWELRRWQRAVVDVGGAFFQLIAIASLVIGYVITGLEPLLIGVWMSVGSIIVSLNPVFKFDGYWLVSDALGVDNLGRRRGLVARHIGRRLCGRPSQLPWPTWITATLFLYSSLSFCILTLFLCKLGPLFWHELTRFPSLIQDTAASIAGGSGLSSALVDLAGSAFILGVAPLMVLRLGLPMARALRSWIATKWSHCAVTTSEESS